MRNNIIHINVVVLINLNFLIYAAFSFLVKDTFNEFILKEKNHRIRKSIIKEVSTGVRVIFIFINVYKIHFFNYHVFYNSIFITYPFDVHIL